MEENEQSGKLRRAMGPLGLMAGLLVIIIVGLVVGARILERPVRYGSSIAETATPNPNASSSATQTPTSADEVPTISVEEVKEKLDSGADVVIVDVRSQSDYNKFHLPGAVSMPFAEINERYSELPRYGEIIVYAECA